MNIAGLQKLSLIDYAPYTSCVIFLPGCNFRCSFCHNPELVLKTASSQFSSDEVLHFLKQRKKWLDAVCVTGGEPCIYPDLPDLIRSIKSLNFKIKLDSNGTNPLMIEQLLKEHLIDYIAMDIKTAPEKYPFVVNRTVDIEKIKKSVSLIMNSGIDYEFRTTVVPGLIATDDFEAIGKWLAGAKRFFIQQFRSKVCLDKSFEGKESFSQAELEAFKMILVTWIKCVIIR